MEPPNAFTGRREAARAAGVLLLALLPSLLAIWCVPWFVTQDGPAHVYNAHVLLSLMRPDSLYRSIYFAQWYPLPNLGGHLLLMALLSVSSARTADLAMMTLTFAGLAFAVVWLRRTVAGSDRLIAILPLAVLAGLNVMWILGFYNFLLGASLASLAMALWWKGRDHPGAWRAAGVSLVLVACYFCHLFAAGLAVLALAVLAAFCPGSNRWRRLLWTAAAVLPLIPLALDYRGLAHAGGAIRPGWTSPPAVLSPGSWIAFLQSADLFRYRFGGAPFVQGTSDWYHFFNPSLWLAAGLALLVCRAWMAGGYGVGAPCRARRAWLAAAIALAACWLVLPDNFGPHGGYLRERSLLIAFVALVPALDHIPRSRMSRAGVACLWATLALQSAFVWDYALHSGRQARELMGAKPHIGNGRRFASAVIGPSRFEANPVLHLDGMLAVDTGNTDWSNYEVAGYFFPTRLCDPDGQELAVALDNSKLEDLQGPRSGSEGKIARWESLLSLHHRRIDILVVWGSDPRVDSIHARWFDPEPVYQSGQVRVLRHR